MTALPATAANTFLTSGGDSGRLIASMDWSQHPIGPIGSWPAALRTALGMVLNSGFPSYIGWGPDFHIFYNDAYRPTLGEKVTLGQGVQLAQLWSEIADEACAIARSAYAGETTYFEDRPFIIERNGQPEQVWFTFSYSPIRDSEGAVHGFLGTVFETTSKMVALARHKRSEARLRLSLDASGTIGTWSVDLETGTTTVDEAFARLFQVDADVAEGGTELERFTNMIHADDRERVLAAIAHSMTTGAPYETEYRIAQRSGAALWVGVRGGLFPDPETGKQRFAGVAVDITARKLEEEQLRATWASLRLERDRSQAIFDGMAEGFASLDSGWIFTEMNEVGAGLARLPREQIVGRSIWQVAPDVVGGPIEPLYRRVSSTRVSENYEYLYKPYSGAPLWVEVRVYPVGEDQLSIFFRDISERKNIEHELSTANRRKDEFLAMLAHELRNPLAPIRAAADLLSIANLPQDRIKKTSAVISRQVAHMTSLVDDLLDVSRVTRGLVILECADLDAKKIAADAVEQVRPLIEARAHRLAVHMPPVSAHVMGDQKRLVQVLTNLLNNAAKYTPEGGNIVLRLEVDGADLVVTVADDGIGMSSEVAERAFELFAQAERTSDRTQGGLGLGLALVKSLDALHRGSVTAHSAGLGQGSQFTLRLPRSTPSASADASLAPAATTTAMAPLTIMIVDDNADAASMLCMFLEASGHDVTVEHRPHLALERARLLRPRVCLLDIGLPDMDGNELARRLRAQPENQDAVLIAVTGYGQEQDRRNTEQAGFDHHLVKPLDMAQLVALLAGVA